jgi:NAD(P)-dependent dehydrogenase (short-subunit alcohol dehydrogenase family)
MLPESSGQASYAAAKAGILMLTVVANNELADFGVRCNAISPSAVTRLAKEHSAMQAMQANISQEYLEQLTRRMRLKPEATIWSIDLSPST